jgi:undecaprenyl diphosphate synthase
MSKSTIPQHVAIIPDGNRRWAKAQGLELFLGHEKGSKRFWEVSRVLSKAGTDFVTIWAASVDNLTKRSNLEVNYLVRHAKREMRDQALINEFIENEVRVRFVGKWNEILKDSELKELIENLESKTENFTKKNITILFGYNGTDDMVEAVKKLKASENQITEQLIYQNLSTNFLPPVDLVIRTGGQPHWSVGFMMWQTANSQFYFSETLWPDFDSKEVAMALDDFSKRERKFGK